MFRYNWSFQCLEITRSFELKISTLFKRGFHPTQRTQRTQRKGRKKRNETDGSDVRHITQ